MIVVSLGASLVVLKHRVERVYEAALGNPSYADLESDHGKEIGYEAAALTEYSMGFRNMIADLLWIMLLQKASLTKYVPSDPDGVSWEYRQLNAIVTLDPDFSEAFHYGSVYLTALKEDPLGAKLFLEHWVKRSPNFWRPHYLLAFHLYHHYHKYLEASRHMVRAAMLGGAPDWIASLGVRLFTESGTLEQDVSLCLQLWKSLLSEEGKHRMALRVAALVEALDREAWVEAIHQYRQKHRKYPSSLRIVRLAYREIHGRQEKQLKNLIPGGVTIPEELKPVFQRVYDYSYDPKTHEVWPKDMNERQALTHLGIYTRKDVPSITKKSL